MAQCERFQCDKCSKIIESWSDGNPYFVDEHSVKQYAYHPDHEALSRCIGNDSPYICLSCANEFMVDSQKPTSRCPKCSSEEIVDTQDLDQKKCPFCKRGTFTRDSEFFVVS